MDQGRPTPTPADAAHVVVVGSGAGGALTALALVRQLGALERPVRISVVDPGTHGDGVGGGVAFSTTDPRHLLNVRARDLSAHLDDPTHFTQWARRTVDPGTCPDDFLPRGALRDYLQEVLDDAVSTADDVAVDRVRATVLALGSAPPRDDGAGAPRCRLVLDTGERLVVDAVVLAVGIEAPGLDWAPPGLLASDCFVPDPWRPGALEALGGADGDVLLVGTGLTMVDVALSVARPGRTVTAVSRRGRLPVPHASSRVAAATSGPLVAAIGDQTALDLRTVRRLVGEHLAAGARRGDWRPAFDGLRPVTSLLWQRMGHADRREFLRVDAPFWDTHRHRMPRPSAAALAARRRAGEVVVGPGEVADASPCAAGVAVTLTDGRRLEVAHVVNCTGPQADVARSRNPLVVDLLATGAGVPGPLGLGLSTDAGGRLVAASAGEPVRPVWAVGSLRRGDLWETTAVPEIRAQAVAVSTQVRALLQAPRPRPASRPVDLHGLALSTTTEAAAAYNLGLSRVLRVQSGAEEAFREAVALDPGFSLGHAALALVGHELGAVGDPAADLAAARATASGRLTGRERDVVEVVAARLHGTRLEAAVALRRHVDAHPRDALVVSAAVPTIAFSGITDLQQESWALVEGLRPAYGDDWWYAGLLAFVRQEQGRYDEADALAARALRQEPGAGHAVHALTHVFYETGQHDAGLAWLGRWIETSGPQASHLAHFSWHAALHELSLGAVEAVHRRYDAELAPPHVTGVRALVDSASLLWRAQVTGSWAGDLPLADLLERVGPELLERPSTPFTAMHAALALTAAGDLASLARLRQHASSRPQPVMRDVVVQLCDALTAVAEQRWHDAVRILRLLGPWLVQLGGSAAQREIVEDTLLLALVRSGRCAEARSLLESRLDRRPSPLDRRRLAGVPG